MSRLVCIAFVVFSTTVFAADPKYPVSAIPENLKINTYGVVRESVSQFNILAKNKSSQHVRKVITILNAKGNSLASQYIWYDRLRKISYIKAAIYNERGDLIKKIKPNEIIDQSAFDGFSLYSDNRVKKVVLSHNVYPYTIEVEYEVEMKFLYSIPTYYIYTDDEVALQKATYTITFPKANAPRYKLNNVKEPVAENLGDKESLTWTFENLKPDRWEKFSPEMRRIVPNIMAGPVEFEYEGYAGKMDTWQNYGMWQNLLNKNRDVLPEATKQKVKELIKEAKSDEEKIKILYQFLQNKTRYVSIQTGIGGLQPFEAKLVDQVGYGDCKALSNYMISMLKEVGIKGYYTKIMAGEHEPDIDIEFPSHQTNHIIVAVPVKNDTLWLECTSQNSPFGYVGTSLDSRYAIMVTETGGMLVRTPSFSENLNVQSRTAHVVMQNNGDATAKIKTHFRGLMYDEAHVGDYADLQYEDQKKWIQKNTLIPTFDINSFSIKNVKDKNPSAVVEQDLTLRKLATVTGKRLFLAPNLMNRSTYIPEKLENRKYPIVKGRSYTDLDTIHYHLPEDIYPEFLPEPVKIKSRFGEYESSFSIEQGNVVYIRKLKMLKGEFPPETYNELIAFYRSINKADHVKIVFLTKT